MDQGDSIYIAILVPPVIDTMCSLPVCAPPTARGDRCYGARLRAPVPRCSPNALWLEYGDVPAHPVWTNETSPGDRILVLAGLAGAGRWVKIYYGWRPNLRDPGDDSLIELAVAGNALAVITHNVRDLRGGELRWPGFMALTPLECLEQFP